MNLRERFEALSPKREPFLWMAQQAAEMTMPELRPLGHDRLGKVEHRPTRNAGSRSEYPWSSDGARALRSLTSMICKLLMPSGVKYGLLDFPQAVWDALEAHGDGLVDAVRGRLEKRATDMINRLDAKNVRTRIKPSIRRTLVESTGLVVTLPSELRMYPLRSFVVRRESGRVAEMILHEKVPVGEQIDASGQSKAIDRWTQVLYPIDDQPGGVWIQEGEDGSPQSAPWLNWRQFIVISGDDADIYDYAPSYVFENIKLLENIEDCERKLAYARGLSVHNWVGVKAGSVLAEQARAMQDFKPGEIVICEPDDVFPISSGVNMADMALVAQMLGKYKEDLAKAFAMGLIDRETTMDTTATAVIRMIEELNDLTEGLFGAFEETLLRPLLWAEYWMIDQESPLFADMGDDAEILLERELELQVLTGISAMEKQRSFNSFLQGLVVAKQMDPTLMVDGERLAAAIGDIHKVDYDGLFWRAEPEPPQLTDMTTPDPQAQAIPQPDDEAIQT